MIQINLKNGLGLENKNNKNIFSQQLLYFKLHRNN